MGYKAYLQRGTAKLDLDTSPYDIAFGFVPPAVTETPNIGTGTSANQYGGGKLIGKRTEPGAYSFSVRIMGNSNAHNEALIDRLDRFIRSGTEAEPVYFCWRPADNVDCEPLYGQWNATRRAKVITGSVYKSAAYYGVYSVRDTVIFADVNMIINPPEGKRQRVATATGGVIEDTIGSADGTSRGVIVAEATTNVITNPIFGHATPLNDWTVGADIIGEVVTDGDYVLFGANAVRLTKLAAGSVYLFAQSYTAAGTATHCLSFYAKKSDGSAVTASDIRPRYSATIPTDATYTAVGNGWYRVYDTFAGIASAEYVGCQMVTTGTTVYVDGFQFEEKAYPTPLAYGDQMGCSWGGTAHDSATTRTAASLKIPAADCIQPSNFTWWIAFRANTNFADHASSVYLLEEATTTANLRVGANGQTVFSDGTNAATGAVTAVTIGQIVVYHATMDSAGMKLYRDGAQDGATQATFVPIEGGTFLHAGSYSNATAQANVTILGAGTYNRALTAAEIALDYANMLQAARGMDGYGGRVDWVPYLWTKDGDNVVDNCDDANRDNWCVVASVPGSVAAETEFLITPSTPSNAGIYYLAHNPVKTFTIPTSQTYYDASGTAEATASGGSVAVLGSAYNVAVYTPADQKEFTGRIHFLARVLNDTGPGYANGAISHTTSMLVSTTAARTAYITCPDDSTYNLYYLGHLNWEYNPKALSSAVAAYEHATGGAKLDYFMAIPGYLAQITDLVVATSIYLNGAKVYGAAAGYTNLSVIGDPIEVRPGKINVLYFLQGMSTNASDITDTATFTTVHITPHWALA